MPHGLEKVKKAIGYGKEWISSIIPQEFKIAHFGAEGTDQGADAFVVDVAVEVEVKTVLEILSL